ncbi:F-actin-capping protein subunit alpha-2 [Ceratobasidium theobromae]|uniref:F-actin-capping protein subunit alpha n=1 Tax=Ceratobasidium theobromae TaxID=1582974 RepID=A0A5N5QR50_9AGAM|nr:F-actin-capping protein subunit alpha-2 [Ceratobasidium theobromae]
MNTSERVSAAASFIVQSPPGEINDVISDLRTIVGDDEALQDGIQPALEEYNKEQFVCVTVPGQEHQVIVSNAGMIPESGRFIDPRSKTSFVFDHLTLTASDPETVEVDAESEPFRSALEESTLKYLAEYFQEGVGSVFASEPGTFIIQIVANKYNPQNFWSGRWRSEYIVDINKGEISSKVLVNVHYYEQGNVQLQTVYTPTLSLPPSLTPSSAPKILAIIAEKEGEHERALSDAYADLGEKSFKSLRRALPLTRQKLDWDKVLGYKLGAELNANRGAFGAS